MAAAEHERLIMRLKPRGEREGPNRQALSRPDRLKPVPAGLSLSSRRGLHRARPRDARFASRICKPQQEITVTQPRRAEADEIAAGEPVERGQEMVLVGEPTLVQ